MEPDSEAVFVPDFSEIDEISKNTNYHNFYLNCIKFVGTQATFNEINKTEDGKKIIVKNMNDMVDDAKKCLELEQSIITIIKNLKEQNLDRFTNPKTEQDMIDYKKYLQDINILNANIIKYIELIEKFTEKKIIS